MGADRLKEIKDQAKRGWNKAGQRLMQPVQTSFFDAEPTFGARSFKIILRDGAKANLKEQLLLQALHNRQFVTRGMEVIGDCPNLPASTIDSLNRGKPVCIEVIGVGAISNTLEVVLR